MAKAGLQYFIQYNKLYYLRPYAICGVDHRDGGSAQESPQKYAKGNVGNNSKAGTLNSEEKVDLVNKIGLITTPAFLDIVDTALVHADCLCGYYAKTYDEAYAVERQIKLLSSYYTEASYLSSKLYKRNRNSVNQNISSKEAVLVRRSRRDGPRPPLDSEAPLQKPVARTIRALGENGIHMVYSLAYCTADRLQSTNEEVLDRAGVRAYIYTSPQAGKYLVSLSLFIEYWLLDIGH